MEFSSLLSACEIGVGLFKACKDQKYSFITADVLCSMFTPGQMLGVV